MRMNPPTVPLSHVNMPSHDDLVRTLDLIRHATAPSHDDGAHHENAFDLADGMLRRVYAARECQPQEPVRSLSREEAVQVDAAVGLVELPPIRLERETATALEAQAAEAGVILQAHVRSLLEFLVSSDDRPGRDTQDLHAWLLSAARERGEDGGSTFVVWAAAAGKERTQARAVRSALRDYHHALDTRRHAGNAAMDMVTALELALGTPWKQGATLTDGGA